MRSVMSRKKNMSKVNMKQIEETNLRFTFYLGMFLSELNRVIDSKEMIKSFEKRGVNIAFLLETQNSLYQLRGINDSYQK